MKRKLLFKSIALLLVIAILSFAILTGCTLLDPENKSINRSITRRITNVNLPPYKPEKVDLKGDFTKEQLDKFNEVYNFLKENSLYDIDHEEMMEAIIEGMSSVFDVYTMYVPEEYANSIRESSSGEYKGIGVTITTPDDGIGAEVISVNPTGDALVQGVKTGDIIIQVEDVRLEKNMSLEYIASLVKGTEGSYVNVTVWRPSQEKEITFSIKRMLINTINASGHMIEDTDIGYIHIESFSTDMLEEFMDAFNRMALKEGMQKVIVDLRDNPGGDFYTALYLADAFIEDGIITTLQDGTGYKEEYFADSYAYDIPMAILVNENSASASELFSGAMQHYELAVIVGKTTYGKGVAQSIFDLKDNSQLRITSYEYLLPDGSSIDQKGVVPDIEVDPFEGYENAYISSLELENDAQLQEAIKILRGN